MRVQGHLVKILRELINIVKMHRPLVMSLSVVVVFVTTYLLILPALTLDRDEAAEQGGIGTPEVVQESVEQAEQNDAVKDVLPPESGTISFDEKDYSVSIDFGKGSGLTEDTDLDVSEIKTSDKDSYDIYENSLIEAINAETGNDRVSDFQFAKFYDITLTSDGKEAQPKDYVDVTIDFEKAIHVKDSGKASIVHFE